jgi:hypothetical protein
VAQGRHLPPYTQIPYQYPHLQLRHCTQQVQLTLSGIFTFHQLPNTTFALRWFRPRELARCQGFPNSIKFPTHNHHLSFAMIGDAVPPPMALIWVYHALSNSKCKLQPFDIIFHRLINSSACPPTTHSGTHCPESLLTHPAPLPRPPTPTTANANGHTSPCTASLQTSNGLPILVNDNSLTQLMLPPIIPPPLGHNDQPIVQIVNDPNLSNSFHKRQRKNPITTDLQDDIHDCSQRNATSTMQITPANQLASTNFHDTPLRLGSNFMASQSTRRPPTKPGMSDHRSIT